MIWLLSMFVQAHDYTWMLPLVVLVIVLSKSKKRKQRQEDIIDLYHILSRAMYCTADSLQLLSEKESFALYQARGSLTKVRFVKAEEEKRADIFQEGRTRIIYGYQYKRP